MPKEPRFLGAVFGIATPQSARQNRDMEMTPRRKRWTPVVHLYECTLGPIVNWLFLQHLTFHTRSFSEIMWMGHRMWQDPFDVCTIQQTIFELRPALLIECGTNAGGAALHYAHLFDLMDHGKVLTIDISKRHNISHSRVEFLMGDSVADETLREVKRIVDGVSGPVMVILDSDHSERHVRKELELYAPFVTPGSYVLAQDGVIDALLMYRQHRPGPLGAIKAFLKIHPEFEVDREKCKRFLVTLHPLGWLRRKSPV